MSLLQYILTEGKRNVIINKIGLPEDTADWVLKNLPKKFQIWGANITRSYMNMYDDIPSHTELGETDYTYLKQLFDRFISIIKEDNKPSTNLREFYTLENTQKVIREWTNIQDWASRVTPSPNLKEMTWDEAIEQATQWHDSLDASDLAEEITEVAPYAEVIHTFDDGAVWVDLHESDCSKLGDIMGHCGKTDADTILQLVTAEGKYRASVAFNYDGMYYQLKGLHNKKPENKYTPYIEWLFTNEGDYQLKSYQPEYNRMDDFHVDDLPSDIYEEVREKYPELENYSRFDKAERLFDDGEDDNALEELNELIREKCGYGSCLQIEEFYDNDFFHLLHAYEPSFVHGMDDFFKFDSEEVKVKLISNSIISEIEEYYLSDNIKDLIDFLYMEVGFEMETDPISFINKLSKKEVNKIIIEIVKENPSEYKRLVSNNRDHTIESVLNRKLELDPSFEKDISNITDSSIKSDMRNLDVGIVREFKEFIHSFFSYCGFIIQDEEIYYLNYVYIDDYYDDVDNLFLNYVTADNVYMNIDERINDYEFDGDNRNVYEALKELGEHLSNLKEEEIYAEEILLHYLLGSEPSEAYKDKLRDYLISNGYLESIDIPTKDVEQSELFK